MRALRAQFAPRLILGLLLASGCAKEATQDSEQDPRPVVAVSVAPLGYLVQRLAGDSVRLLVMIPAAASPATHEPTMGQMQLLSEAALYVKVGHPAFAFEHSWLGRLLESNRGMTVVDASRQAMREVGDPHLWTSPQVMRNVAQDIAVTLETILPNDSTAIHDNLQKLVADMETLDRQIKNLLEEHTGKSFYVFHPAWGWFAANYGLKQVAIEQQGAHGSEPSPEELARIIDQARLEKASVIFVQPQFSTRSAQVIADEVGMRVVAMDPLAADWLDNMRRFAIALREAWTP